MATNPVNLVDAIADVIPRIAQARTATLRIGKITALATGVATVQVGGSTGGTVKARYFVGYTPVVGHIVALITEKDVWLILGRISTT